MPYGFQPIYLQPGPGGFPPLPQGLTWTVTPTPPSSDPRRRAPTAEEYYMAGSPPQQFLPMHPSAFGMAPTYRDTGAENPQQPPTRHY